MQVTDHARQLMEKHLRKPFFDGGYAGSTPRMAPEDVAEGIAWVDDRFFPIRYEDEALPSVDWVLNVAKAAVLRYSMGKPALQRLVLECLFTKDAPCPRSVRDFWDFVTGVTAVCLEVTIV